MPEINIVLIFYQIFYQIFRTSVKIIIKIRENMHLSKSKSSSLSSSLVSDYDSELNLGHKASLEDCYMGDVRKDDSPGRSVFEEYGDLFSHTFPSINHADDLFIGNDDYNSNSNSNSNSSSLGQGLNSDIKTCDIKLFKQGYFSANSYRDYIDKSAFEFFFWVGLVCSSLKQYEPALGFWVAHGDAFCLDVNTSNLDFSYWACFLVSIPCAFSQAGLAIQGKKPYSNKFKTINLISINADLVKIYGESNNKNNNFKSSLKKSLKKFLVYTMAFTGVVSQTYWIGAQFWVLPYFEKDLGFKNDMANYFYYFNSEKVFDPKFIFALLITLGGAKGYWAQLVHYSNMLLDGISNYGNKSSYDNTELKKKELFAKFIVEVKNKGRMFFNGDSVLGVGDNDAKHPLYRDISSEIYWRDENFASYVSNFFDLLFFDEMENKENGLDRNQKYRFKVSDIESSVISGLFRRYILSPYKKYNCGFAKSKLFRFGIIWPLAVIGLYQNAFAFMTIFENAPGFKNYLSNHYVMNIVCNILSWTLGITSILNHIAFNIEGIDDLARVKAAKVDIVAYPLLGVNPIGNINTVAGYDQLRDNIEKFNGCKNNFIFFVQGALNIWLISVVTLASIFTALVSTKENPFPDESKISSNLWFGFSILVVISQIVTQITTKGEKSMKFVKYLAKGFSESNKNSLVYPDKFAESKNNIISLVYKLLLELKELYCEDYIHEKDKFDDKSLGEVVQDICVFYSTKDDVGDVIDNSACFDDGFDDNDRGVDFDDL